jgi:hypothetical protein
MVLCLSSWTASSARAQGAETTPWVGERGITETVEQIMERGRRNGEPRPWDGRVRMRPEPEVPRDWQRQNPDSPPVPMWPPATGARSGLSPVIAPGSGGSGNLNLPQTVGTNFLATQISDTIGYVPPDTVGSVSPTQVLVCSNGIIRVFDKLGNPGGLSTSTDNFFGSVLGMSSSSDPQVKYDRLSGRWIVTMINVSTNSNRVMIAVSSGSTITSQSSFTFYFFQQDTVAPTGNTGQFADYPKTGVDANAIVIGCNMFTNGSASGTYAGTTAWVVRKTSVLSGGPIVVTALRGLVPSASAAGPESPTGIDDDDPTATFSYIVGMDNASFGLLVVRRISNPGGSPTVSGNLNVTVPTTILPISQPSAGSSHALDSIDDRLFAAQIHKNRLTGTSSLWTAHNIQVDATGVANGSGGRNGSRWYQVDNLATTPSLTQSGTLFDTAGSNPRGFWMPSLAMSGQGHVALGTSYANATVDHPGAAVAGRLSGDPLGTIQAPTLAVVSSHAYNLQNSTPQRWGDFSAVMVDPSDDQTLWAFAEYSNPTTNSNGSWGVQAIQLRAPPPATPTSASPPTIAPGASNVSVVVTGTSTSGSGFYDTEPGINRMAATIDGGGVTVNSITFTSPTQFTMNVSVASNATTGARTITVTNPDGQMVTSASGVCTICSGNTTTAVNDSATVCSGSSVDIPVLANDGTSCGLLQCSSLTIVTPPAHGTATVQGCSGAGACSGCVVHYVASAGYVGPDSFVYQISNNQSPPSNGQATCSITVCTTTAVNDTATVCSGSSVDVQVLANDSTACGSIDCSTLTITSAPLHGTATVQGCSGNCTGCVVHYVPAAGYSGPDSFGYSIKNNQLPLCTGTATCSITVCATNAVNDTASVCSGSAVDIPVLANDTASCGSIDCSTLTVTSAPLHGTATVQNCTGNCAGCVVHYVPAAGYSGPDSFNYSVRNNQSPACTGTATCSITVCATNAVNDSANVCAGSSADIHVLANDTTTCGSIDCTTLTITSPPSHGTASVQNCSGNCTSCAVHYTPSAGYTGPDSFGYSVSNNQAPACVGSATCSITVCETSAADDTATVSSNSFVDINVLANDTTTCGSIDCTTLTITSPPSHGTATVEGCSGNCTSCVVRYIPTAGYSGPDGFSYGVANTQVPACTGTANCSVMVVNAVSGVAYCFGDGLDPLVTTMCPCGNSGTAGHGCANSSNAGGAQLSASGTTSPDTIVETVTGERTTALSIFVQGTTSANAGIVFGDGVRCVSGSLKRLYSKSASGGVASAPGAGDPSISARSAALGDPIPSGGTRYYQVYYRDPDPNFCPSATFNISNGWIITWQ